MRKYILKNERETREFAERFVKKLRGAEVIGLIGELGAGKTVFVKGLAKGLGIRQKIHSPTFVLMKIYKTKTTESFIAFIAYSFRPLFTKQKQPA